MSLIRRNVMVTGDVQGVFFRDTCRRVASDAGVSGWATNLADGRVEVALEGEERAVEKVIDWCRHGPRGAIVDAVDVTESEPEGLSGFSIR
jgi:acylphosphatase